MKILAMTLKSRRPTAEEQLKAATKQLTTALRNAREATAPSQQKAWLLRADRIRARVNKLRRKAD